MNTYDAGRDRTAELLSQALSEEAAMVDPNPGALQAIQRRTATKAPSRSRWVVGAWGAGLATAAVIATVVLVGGNGPDDGSGVPAVGRPDVETVQDGMHDGVYDPDANAQAQHTMVYLGPQPDDPTLAPRLYAEPHTVEPTDEGDDFAAVHEFFTSTAIDPDYRSGWPAGVDIEAVGYPYCAHLCVMYALTGTADLSDPGELTHPQAVAAIQAFLRSAGEKPGIVAIVSYNGNRPLTTLLGVDVSKGITVAPDDELRPWISIDNLVEGQTVSSPVTVQVSGNVFEGTVNWTLTDSSGAIVDEGYATTSMGMWSQADVRLGALEPGTYTFEAFESSADNGSKLNADTKTLTVN